MKTPLDSEAGNAIIGKMRTTNWLVLVGKNALFLK